MIVDALLSVFSIVAETVLGWLPDVAPPEIAASVANMAPLFGLLAWANKYAPIVEAAAMLALLGTIYLTLYLIRFSVWIIGKLPFMGD